MAQFDPVSTRTVVSKSPILQARLNNMAKERERPQPPAPPAPVFNVVLPNNLYGVYQDPPALPAPWQAATMPEPAMAPTLILPNYIAGEKIDLSTFRTIFALPESVKQHLEKNAITGTHAFAHITSQDLKDIGLKFSEIIDLKEAVKEWAQKYAWFSVVSTVIVRFYSTLASILFFIHCPTLFFR
jgi:hypothetical protein